MKQMPEDSLEIKSIEDFGLYLLGHEDFRDCRGKQDVTIEQLMVNILDQADSPSQARKNWDIQMSKLRVMLYLAAKLKRDGKFEMLEELFRQLTKPDLILPGETKAGEDLRPVTVFMFEPEKTITLLIWMQVAPEEDLYRYALTKECKCDLTPGLFEQFPSLWKYAVQWRNISPKDQAGRALCLAYCDDVLSQFPSKLIANDGIKLDACGLIPNLPQALPKKVIERYLYWYGEPNSKDSFFAGMLGTIYPSFAFASVADQKEVLSQFTRGQQDKIGVWELALPTKIGHMQHQYNIGLHPEGEHGYWSKRWPLFASRSVNHGYGAYFITDPYDGEGGQYKTSPKLFERKDVGCYRISLRGHYYSLFGREEDDDSGYKIEVDKPIQEITRKKEREKIHDFYVKMHGGTLPSEEEQNEAMADFMRNYDPKADHDRYETNRKLERYEKLKEIRQEYEQKQK